MSFFSFEIANSRISYFCQSQVYKVHNEINNKKKCGRDEMKGPYSEKKKQKIMIPS